MQESSKILQALGIPYSALVSIIFGMMLLSFPIGAYVVFNSDVGDEINFEYPVRGFDFFLAGIGYQVPIEFELGDAFIVLWCIFLILFTISIFGSHRSFLKTLIPILSGGKQPEKTNYLVEMIKWFTVLIVVSGIIDFIQEGFGIATKPPTPDNWLIQFFDVTSSPIVEEIGFRVLLIGVPLFLIYSQRASIRFFFKSLWRPRENLHIVQAKKAWILIILVGIFFGAAHIISGEPWSIGKFAQAAASGIIIGWVYFNHGLVPAILIHWATNYFIFSYVYFIADINLISIQDAFSQSLTNTLEILLIVTGVISASILLVNYLYSKKEKKLEI